MPTHGLACLTNCSPPLGRALHDGGPSLRWATATTTRATRKPEPVASSTTMTGRGVRRSMLAFRSVMPTLSSLVVRSFSTTSRPAAGGRLRRPSSAGYDSHAWRDVRHMTETSNSTVALFTLLGTLGGVIASSAAAVVASALNHRWQRQREKATPRPARSHASFAKNAATFMFAILPETMEFRRKSVLSSSRQGLGSFKTEAFPDSLGVGRCLECA